MKTPTTAEEMVSALDSTIDALLSVRGNILMYGNRDGENNQLIIRLSKHNLDFVATEIQLDEGF